MPLWCSELRAATTTGTPDRKDDDAFWFVSAEVDVTRRLWHEHAPLFSTAGESVQLPAVGISSDLLKGPRELFFEKASSTTVLNPPARAPLDLAQCATRKNELHLMVRSAAQTSS